MTSTLCQVCYEETFTSMSSCCGRACETCMWKMFTTTIKNTHAGYILLTCPACGDAVTDEVAGELLAYDVFERLQANRQTQLVKMEYVSCAWCNAEFDVTKAQTWADDMFVGVSRERPTDRRDCVMCPECKQDVCRGCGSRYEFHAGVSCTNYLTWAVENQGEWETSRAKNFDFYFSLRESNPYQAEMQGSIVSKQRDMRDSLHMIHGSTKPCPDCSIRIEKNGGCNHHTHHCHGATTASHFCWECLDRHADGTVIANGVRCAHGITRYWAQFAVARAV
ncbi:hypothetical protein CAOG_06006 [Capsaspora owczarzaki ATCC 30864]|uniref:RING-type domain-containing protein n=1 Tax=Capsaspora owczarzaki (strain ATCC 30864) TaxID=595528 RepID=A0A0D2WUF8_CAPO3|nr:hypothetical protein CAOG_06006 [Capsaspora owczarzaki ATCC 30864]KJE95563.1 hypothetical protein CAOG_006006 [Capsaspora owczarzaki ATCC 30864]|eukprot:XP_004345596.1 hypothetical protein CAOG_06006 [Capsaspora owczarzaki ATCC 30864]